MHDRGKVSGAPGHGNDDDDHDDAEYEHHDDGDDVDYDDDDDDGLDRQKQKHYFLLSAAHLAHLPHLSGPPRTKTLLFCSRRFVKGMFGILRCPT